MSVKISNYFGRITVTNGESIDIENSEINVVNTGTKPCHVRYINSNVEGKMESRSHTIINNYNKRSCKRDPKHMSIVCNIFIQPESSSYPYCKIENDLLQLDKVLK